MRTGRNTVTALALLAGCRRREDEMNAVTMITLNMKTNRIVMLGLAALAPLLVSKVQAYYNPTTGRWLTRDPVGEQGGHALYAQTRNASNIAVDPLGLTWKLSMNYWYNVPLWMMENRIGRMEPTVYAAAPGGSDVACGFNRMMFQGYILEVKMDVMFLQDRADAIQPYPTMRSSAWAHEERHVELHRMYYTAIDQAYSTLAGQCVCMSCYRAWKNYVAAARTYEFDENEIANARWDIADYLRSAEAEPARQRRDEMQAKLPQDEAAYRSSLLDFHLKCAGFF